MRPPRLAPLALALTFLLAPACTSDEPATPVPSPSSAAPEATMQTPVARASSSAIPPAVQIATKTPESIVPTPVAYDSWPTGIFETGQAPLPSTYRIRNQWQSDDGHIRLQLWAGGVVLYPEQGADTEQGILVLSSQDLESHDQRGNSFLTDHEDSAIRIVHVDGSLITLVSDQGRLLGFDVQLEEFVEPAALPIWGSGIGDLGELAFPAGQPFPDRSLNIKNVWQGTVDGMHVRIFAGSSLRAPEHGLLVLQQVPANLWPPDFLAEYGPDTLFEATSIVGPLHVDSAEGGLVRLRNDQGEFDTFDIRARAFDE